MRAFICKEIFVLGAQKVYTARGFLLKTTPNKDPYFSMATSCFVSNTAKLSFYTNGILHRKETIANGLRHGLGQVYNSSGTLAFEMLYIRNIAVFMRNIPAEFDKRFVVPTENFL